MATVTVKVPKNVLRVKDLIAKLQKENPEAIIASTSSNFEKKGATEPSSGYYKFKGDFKEETFVDGFDYESYNSTVIRHNDQGEHEFLKF
jgi:hypothetical protein